LLRDDRRRRQRQAERLRHLDHDPEILLVQPRLDAGGEIARGHLRAHQVEHPAAGHAGLQRRQHARRLDAIGRREQHRFGDALDVDHLHDLVARLDDLAGAVAADVRDRAPELLEERAGALEHRGVAADDDRQRCLLRAHRAARHRAVEHVDPLLRETPREVARGDRRDRREVDDDASRGQRRRSTVLAEQHRLDVGGVGDVGADELGTPGRLGRRGRVARAARDQRARRVAAPNVDRDVVARIEQVPDHRRAHRARTDESDRRHRPAPLQVRSRRSIRRRGAPQPATEASPPPPGTP
jgi:hypothetical protein